MPKFMLILRDTTRAAGDQLTADDFARILGEYEAWSRELAAEGRVTAGNKLTDHGGKVIWPRPGRKVEVQDGPYVESKEVVGGYHLLKADDYQHAVRLCAGHPHLQFGSIEVRQIDFMGGPED